ncbi:MAG TPA: hypothetical protein VHC96_20480 [Puia sp.]|jgi:hypothetical protein|nr:hypothetical protein [Puia sp.]
MLFDKGRTVFISGSAYEYGSLGDVGKPFVKDLTRTLLKNNFRIISGFGLGVGSSVVEGALDEVYSGKREKISDHLHVYPFPSSHHLSNFKDCYREDMISQAGIAIFIFGNKLEDISIREADGMLKEFEIARSYNARMIPVGASGYVAERLWLQVLRHYDDYFDTREKFELFLQLGAPYTRPERLIDLILQLAK